jgi:hypothetical protein
MALKEIYIEGINAVKAGDMSPEALWEIFEEQLNNKQTEIFKLTNEYQKVLDKYVDLLELVSNAYKEHKNLSDD